MHSNILALGVGQIFDGEPFGSSRPVCGEVVFNTGMAGYVETLTDPSYAGQMLVLTYPLAGNYGVPEPRVGKGLAGPYESDRIQVQGLVVQHYVDDFSHHAASRSLRRWLLDEDVPAVTGVDTRTLTRLLREHGTMRGWMYPSTMSLDEAKTKAASVDMHRGSVYRAAPPSP